MKGLLIKDLKIIGLRKKFILIFVAIGVYMAFTNSVSFSVGYITMLAMMMSISTITYDEYNNGFMYLMTFPCTTKDYVREKYILCLCTTILSSICAGLLVAISVTVGKAGESMGEMLMIIPAMAIIGYFVAVISIPLQIKFGGENGKTALFIVYGIIMVIAVAISHFTNAGDIDIRVILNSIPESLLLIAAVAITIGCMCISYKISINEMNKKYI